MNRGGNVGQHQLLERTHIKQQSFLKYNVVGVLSKGTT